MVDGVPAMGVERVWRSASRLVLDSTVSCATRAFIVVDEGAGPDVGFLACACACACEWEVRGGRVILDDAGRALALSSPAEVGCCWRLVWVAPRVEFWRS